MKQELIDYIKVIDGMLFYYETIEGMPFIDLDEDMVFTFVSNIVGEKMQDMLGKEMWNEYLISIKPIP